MAYKFKHKEDEKMFHELHPVLKGLFVMCVVPWLNQMGVDPVVVTRTVDSKIEGVSMSEIHADFRAIDIRSKNFPKGLAEAFEIKFNAAFAQLYGAVGSLTGTRRFVLYERSDDKKTEHLHLQTLKGLPYNAFLEDYSDGKFMELCK